MDSIVRIRLFVLKAFVAAIMFMGMAVAGEAVVQSVNIESYKVIDRYTVNSCTKQLLTWTSQCPCVRKWLLPLRELSWDANTATMHDVCFILGFWENGSVFS
ncbi:hypothetical protein CAPTEDRAFT_208195 [Capitella teleta]|uniref:Uncharacterized protein n=1 Tax=Capitella teleta TaxID=283909 RepID=R7T5T8_CAPTE|nr:hypothetical protein CAPTEDRAFT_208195 [Capitella teleta]|eukprot:ELT88764.1 hypothetical protein CAPTEDRAFT_208195 [Capitella teleta]